MRLLIGTDDGLFQLNGDRPRRLRGGKVTHLATGDGATWAISDDRVERVADGTSDALSMPEALKPRCLLPTPEALLIGTSRARLFRVDGGDPVPVEGFDAAPGRDEWHTPWGGPPDTRSLARDVDGALYANVHVGGVLRSDEREQWQPTMDIDADVHQVSAHPTIAGCVLVASARGLGTSFDGARTWDFTRDGLHNGYARAVAAAGEMLFLSASDGPRGGRAALYRRHLRSNGPLERCSSGLPEWFEGNIDSGCLVAAGETVAFGSAQGSVYLSTDAGASWAEIANELPPVRALGAGGGG